MTSLPTGWPGRALALSLACLALGTVYVTLVVPLLDLYSERAMRLDASRLLLQKLNAAAGELPALRARVAELTATVHNEKLTLEGGSDGVASAVLQGHIEELAAVAGVTIRSTESLATEAHSAYRRLGLRLSLSGPYDSLVKLLAEIEEATPPLLVDNLQIRSILQRPGFAPTSSLDASLDVYGLRI